MIVIVLLIAVSCDGVDKELIYYDNGNIKSETEVVESVKNGQQRTYYIDGTLESKLSWANDTLEGYYENYYKDGILSDQGFYSRGVLHGPYAIYYESGQFMQKGRYNNGIRSGIQYMYSPNGNLLSVKNFVNFHGEEKIVGYISYDSVGDVKEETTRVVIRPRKDTISIDETFLADIILKKPYFNSTQVIVGEYSSSFELLDESSLDTMTADSQIVRYSTTSHEKGENFIRGYADNFEVVDQIGDTTITKNAHLYFEFEYFVE